PSDTIRNIRLNFSAPFLKTRGPKVLSISNRTSVIYLEYSVTTIGKELNFGIKSPFRSSVRPIMDQNNHWTVLSFIFRIGNVGMDILVISGQELHFFHLIELQILQFRILFIQELYIVFLFIVIVGLAGMYIAIDAYHKAGQAAVAIQESDLRILKFLFQLFIDLLVGRVKDVFLKLIDEGCGIEHFLQIGRVALYPKVTKFVFIDIANFFAIFSIKLHQCHLISVLI